MNQTRPPSGRRLPCFQILALTPLLLAVLASCAPPPEVGEADVGISLQALAGSEVIRMTLTVSAPDISPSSVGGRTRSPAIEGKHVA